MFPCLCRFYLVAFSCATLILQAVDGPFEKINQKGKAFSWAILKCCNEAEERVKVVIFSPLADSVQQDFELHSVSPKPWISQTNNPSVDSLRRLRSQADHGSQRCEEALRLAGLRTSRRILFIDAPRSPKLPAFKGHAVLDCRGDRLHQTTVSTQ